MIESKSADTATMLGKEYTFFLSNDNSLNEFYYSYQLYSPGLSDSGMPLVSLTKITEKIGKTKKWGEKGETTSSLPYGKGSDILQYLMGSGKEKKQYQSFLKTVLRKEGVNIFSNGNDFPNIEMIFGEKNSLQKSVIIHLRDLNRWKNFRFMAGKQIDLLYSPTEFIESSKYYVGYKSPIQVARQERSYSAAWLHHKGRNKHHEEYWYDFNAPIKAPVIPYKYTIEMLCDNLSAGIVYKGKKFTNDYPLWYWDNVKNKEIFHPKMVKFFDDIFAEISGKGINNVLNKKNLKDRYKKYCE